MKHETATSWVLFKFCIAENAFLTLNFDGSLLIDLSWIYCFFHFFVILVFKKTCKYIFFYIQKRWPCKVFGLLLQEFYKFMTSKMTVKLFWKFCLCCLASFLCNSEHWQSKNKAHDLHKTYVLSLFIIPYFWWQK